MFCVFSVIINKKTMQSYGKNPIYQFLSATLAHIFAEVIPVRKKSNDLFVFSLTYP